MSNEKVSELYGEYSLMMKSLVEGDEYYQLLKQPRIGPSKGQQRGVAVVDAAADKRSHWFLGVRRVAKHTVKPRLRDSVICDCVAVVGELPRRVYWRARVEVEMTERPNQIGGVSHSSLPVLVRPSKVVFMFLLLDTTVKLCKVFDLDDAEAVFEKLSSVISTLLP